jgi:hypothetical protein
MDANGWVLISILASFNRIKNLTSDLSIVVECLRMTPLLEVSPKGTHVRLRQQWPEWVLPNATTNEEVKKEFEEAEKNKTEQPEEKKEEDETKPETTTVTPEVAATPATEEKKTEEESEEVKVDEPVTEEIEEVAKPRSPSSDEVSIRSPTLKSQCEYSLSLLVALPVLPLLTRSSPYSISPESRFAESSPR